MLHVKLLNVDRRHDGSLRDGNPLLLLGFDVFPDVLVRMQHLGLLESTVFLCWRLRGVTIGQLLVVHWVKGVQQVVAGASLVQ